MPVINKSDKNYHRFYKDLGITFDTTEGENVKADACPFCSGTKFAFNNRTGTYQCLSVNKCGEKGNAYTFLRWFHQECLDATTDEQYRALKAKRGLPLQTLKRHKIAWCEELGCYLVPFVNEKGEAVNLLRYWPETGKRYLLSELPAQIFGRDQFSSDSSRPVFLLEGHWDYLALDHHLRVNRSRDRYDLLAVPGANIFKDFWGKNLKGRTVRVCFDNDKAGRDGQQRIVKIIREQKIDCQLLLLNWPDSYPEKCDIGDLVKEGENIVRWTQKNCHKISASASTIKFVRGDQIPDKKSEWLWKKRIPLNDFVSLAGWRGDGKSTIAYDIAARATAGLPMPNETTALDPMGVMILTSEVDASKVRDIVRLHGGDLTRLWVHDIASTDDPVDVLENIPGFEQQIRELGIRVIIIDALNSFITGEINTDSKARRNVSGPLAAIARRTGCCIIGIRNWNNMSGVDAAHRALGATSLSDVSRCAMNTKCLEPLEKGGPKRFRLEWERVSDANPNDHQPLPYAMKDLSTGDADSHHRVIVWGKPSEEREKEFEKAFPKKVAKKAGKKSERTHTLIKKKIAGKKR